MSYKLFVKFTIFHNIYKNIIKCYFIIKKIEPMSCLCIHNKNCVTLISRKHPRYIFSNVHELVNYF